jgi:hypothetical protein
MAPEHNAEAEEAGGVAAPMTGSGEALRMGGSSVRGRGERGGDGEIGGLHAPPRPPPPGRGRVVAGADSGLWPLGPRPYSWAD